MHFFLEGTGSRSRGVKAAGPDRPVGAMLSDEATLLTDLPDCVLGRILAALDGASLSRAGGTCRGLASIDSSQAWERLCEQAGAPNSGAAPAERYRKHAATLCRECRRPTPYVFAPLRVRLCERCERSNPHKFALATRAMLLGDARFRLLLGRRPIDSLLANVPSHRCNGFIFYVRPVAAAAAQSGLEVEAAKEGEEAEAGERAAAAEPPSEIGVCPSEEEQDEAVGVEAAAAAWDAAGEEHSRLRSAKNAARAARRLEQKEHRRKVKQEARAKRHGGGEPAAGSATAVAPWGGARRGDRPKRAHPKMAPKSAHVLSRGDDELLAEVRLLEETFGDALAGLSGLTLASS